MSKKRGRDIACYKPADMIEMLRETLASRSGVMRLPTGNIVCINKTHRTFLRCGTNCLECGREGKYFLETTVRGHEERSSLRLYGDGKPLSRGKPVTYDSGIYARIGFTADHILPKSIGGTGNDVNLRTLCAFCDSYKGAFFDGDFRFLFRIASYKDLLRLKYGEDDPRYAAYMEDYVQRFYVETNHIVPSKFRNAHMAAQVACFFNADPYWGYVTLNELHTYAAQVERDYGISASLDDMTPFKFVRHD